MESGRCGSKDQRSVARTRRNEPAASPHAGAGVRLMLRFLQVGEVDDQGASVTTGPYKETGEPRNYLKSSHQSGSSA
jgi:hypothetical protein